jgi:ribosomal-protein-alanine N-acetyltransferase
MNVRIARPEDRWAIEHLVRNNWRALLLPWAWEHLLGRADAPFVVLEHQGTLSGALFAWPDGAPVAWVRLAALSNGMNMGVWLDKLLPPLLRALQQGRVEDLMWLDYWGWTESHLAARGFRPLIDVITLRKRGRDLPALPEVDVELRDARAADVAALVRMDRAAFSAHWHHGPEAMRYSLAISPHFVVAECQGQLVGYVEGVLRKSGAHLNRIAVDPRYQGRNIGATLLHDALNSFWRKGAAQVSLNTQRDNLRSQRLYRRFGFRPTGDVATAWVRAIPGAGPDPA